jgi:hypothetical protein
MGHTFFESTQRARERVTELFDFIWPTAVGMWNIRWQVLGYLGARPDATDLELHGRFSVGSGLVQRAALRKACAGQTWDHQTERFASIILINLFSLHESWCEELLHEIGHHSDPRVKRMQFPSVPGKRPGILDVLAELSATPSPIFQRVYSPSLTSERHYSRSVINNIMFCYRYFKELRNCLAHAGGVADQKALDAHRAFQNVANTTDLNVSEVPNHFAIGIGQPARLSLRGVIGFGGTLLQIIRTVDAEVAVTSFGEDSFRKRWRLLRPQIPGHVDRSRVIRKVLYRMCLPSPHSEQDLHVWIRAQGLI